MVTKDWMEGVEYLEGVAAFPLFAGSAWGFHTAKVVKELDKRVSADNATNQKQTLFG